MDEEKLGKCKYSGHFRKGYFKFICGFLAQFIQYNQIKQYIIFIYAWFTLVVRIGDFHCMWSLVCKMLCLSEKNTIDPQGAPLRVKIEIILYLCFKNLLESRDSRLFLLSKFCKHFKLLGVIILSLYMTFHKVQMIADK